MLKKIMYRKDNIMHLFENFMTPDEADKIETAMLALPWYFNTIEGNLSNASQDTPVYFVNLIGCESHGTTSDDIKPFVPLILKLEKITGRSFKERISRVKANLYTKRPDFPENFHHKPHLDFYNEETKLGDEGEVFLYYGNTSDGDTYFFNEKRIDTKTLTITDQFPHIKGNGLLFDNTILHASSSPKISEYRMNINFVFRK